MRYRILQISRNSIPYVRELNVLTGGMIGSVLMQQLDYWFDKYPDGFYKFLTPSEAHPAYKPGQSWCEELAISHNEFRNAFEKIGIRYSSKGEYDAVTGDKFQGRMYCCYIDKRQNLTYYYRNHDLVDQNLEMLMTRGTVDQPAHLAKKSSQVIDSKADTKSSSQTREKHVSGDALSTSQTNGNHASGNALSMSQTSTKSISADLLSESQQTGKPIFWETGKPVSAEAVNQSPENGLLTLPTTEPTKEPSIPLQQSAHGPAGGAVDNSPSGSGSDLSELQYPNVTDAEKAVLGTIMDLCPLDKRQSVLDEVEGVRRSGGIKSNVIGFAAELVRRVGRGEFSVAAGAAVRGERELRQANEQRVAQARQRPVQALKSTEVAVASEALLQTLPAGIAARARAAIERQALATVTPTN